MPGNHFYPQLKQLIEPDVIPEDFSTFELNVGGLLNGVFYKNLKLDDHDKGDTLNAELTVVVFDSHELTIPGTNGTSLSFNSNGQTSEYKIRLGYRLEALKHLRGFKSEGFNYALEGLAGFFTNELNQTNLDALFYIIGRFYPTSDPVDDFVNDFNQTYNPSNPISKSSDPDKTYEQIVEDLESQITGQNFNLKQILISDYILEGSDEDQKEKLSAYSSHILGGTFGTDLMSFFRPAVYFSLEDLNVSLKFPRDVLIPLDSNNEPLPEPEQSEITFTVGRVFYSSRQGLNFQNNSGLSFTNSEIMNTGFTLSFNEARIDLSQNTAIPEVRAAGYPRDFIGVYISEATIGLPPFLIPDGTPPVIKGENLIIGTGGFSGKLTLDAGGQLKLGSNDGFSMGLDAFSLNFQQNSITDSAIKGWLKIPGFKQQGSTDDAKIGIEASFENNGDFHITADQNNGLQIIEVPDVMKININSLEVGREDNDYYIALYRMVESPRSKVGARNVYTEISNTIKCTEEELLINYV